MYTQRPKISIYIATSIDKSHNMKKFIAILMTTFLTTFSLIAAPQAIVFDFGGVMTGEPKKEAVVQFLRSTFCLSEAEFEKVNLEKREAVKAGKSDEEFWLQFAEEKGIVLSPDWPQTFKTVMKEAIGINPEMYVLVAELKAKQIPVALLSNIDTRLAKLVRDFGLYEPFEPCLLSCEIGVEKPDIKAYEILLTKMHVPVGDIIFVDDRQENIDAATHVGLDAILFQSETQLRRELLKRKLL
jgi:HAD superfamily hydrolase (TIGR01509 family)